MDHQSPERAEGSESLPPAPRQISWSYSGLKDYETCPHRIKLKLERAPTLPQEENRGTVIHGLAEAYVKGELSPLPRELRKFDTQFEADRALFASGQMEIESEWGFTPDWEPCSWFDAWLRVKCDQVVHLEPGECRIVDHKTGKSFGNEVPHLQQAQLYALAAFMRYAELNHIETEMRYLDEGKVTRKLWTRDRDCLRLLQQYTKRVTHMMIDQRFQPNPTRMACRFCRYGSTTGSSACAHAIPWDSL